MEGVEINMWFAKSPEEIIHELSVNPATGLSTAEAQARR